MGAEAEEPTGVVVIVYVVFHADIEDDRYVRGVFSNEDLAKALVVDVDPCEESHGHTDLHPHARVYSRSGTKYPQPSDARGCYMARAHHGYCCGVEAYTVDARKPVVIVEGDAYDFSGMTYSAAIKSLGYELPEADR